MSTSTHLLYIDDSGTKDYSPTRNYTIGSGGCSRYFLLCGVLLDIKSAAILADQVIKLKTKYFGTKLVEIKSSWLRNPEKRLKFYTQPFGIDDLKIRDFVEELYSIIDVGEFKLIASVVDKLHMQEDYPSPWYATTVAYETLILRVQQELNKLAIGMSEVGVIVDDTSGKTPRGNPYRELLDSHHRRLKQQGSKLWKTSLPSLGKMRFANSQTSNLIQIADVCAYNTLRQFQEFGEEWEDEITRTLPMYPYFQRISKKFRRSETGRINGFGLIKMPQRRKKLWGVKLVP